MLFFSSPSKASGVRLDLCLTGRASLVSMTCFTAENLPNPHHAQRKTLHILLTVILMPLPKHPRPTPWLCQTYISCVQGSTSNTPYGTHSFTILLHLLLLLYSILTYSNNSPFRYTHFILCIIDNPCPCYHRVKRYLHPSHILKTPWQHFPIYSHHSLPYIQNHFKHSYCIQPNDTFIIYISHKNSILL